MRIITYHQQPFPVPHAPPVLHGSMPPFAEPVPRSLGQQQPIYSGGSDQPAPGWSLGSQNTMDTDHLEAFAMSPSPSDISPAPLPSQNLSTVEPDCGESRVDPQPLRRSTRARVQAKGKSAMPTGMTLPKQKVDTEGFKVKKSKGKKPGSQKSGSQKSRTMEREKRALNPNVLFALEKRYPCCDGSEPENLPRHQFSVTHTNNLRQEYKDVVTVYVCPAFYYPTCEGSDEARVDAVKRHFGSCPAIWNCTHRTPVMATQRAVKAIKALYLKEGSTWTQEPKLDASWWNPLIVNPVASVSTLSPLTISAISPPPTLGSPFKMTSSLRRVGQLGSAAAQPQPSEFGGLVSGGPGYDGATLPGGSYFTGSSSTVVFERWPAQEQEGSYHWTGPSAGPLDDAYLYRH